MIPLELTLRNFMSYGETEVAVDFSGLHTLCLSGENGHGKSALLDAITWALWGETRLGRQNHEQLIRAGADEMAVTLTFSEGERTLRVRRQRSKKAGAQIWELQQADCGGGWRPLTGASSTDTGKAIQQIVRMSYDTFLNSAYLRQGRADEFVRQTPGKRKEILAEILELSRYDALEAMARQRRTEAADAALDCQRSLNRIEAELGEEATHQGALIKCQERALTLAGEREAAGARWEKLKELRATLQSQREQARRLEEDFHALGKDIESWQADLATEQETIAAEKALIKDRERIVDRYDKLQAARARSDELSELVRCSQRVEKERMAAEAELNEARRDLERSLRDAESVWQERRLQVDEIPMLWEQREAFLSRLDGFRDLEREETGLRSRKEELGARFAVLKEQKKVCDERLEQARQRLVRIGQQKEVCNVCGSPLTANRIAAIREDCEREIGRIDEEQGCLTQEARACRQEAEKIDRRVQEIADAMGGLQRLRDDIGRKQQVIQDREEIAKALPELEREIERLRKELEEGRYAIDARERLAAASLQAERYRGVDREFAEARGALRELADAEIHYHALAHAEEKLAKAQRRLERAQGTIQTLLARQTQKLAEREALAGIEPKFVETEQVLASLKAHLDDLAGQTSRVEQERGRLQQILARCRQLRNERERLQAERDTARKDEEAFGQLAAAFGKRGVQALIIENALPELQEEANSLLERLTDGDMSVSIQTTRAARSRAAGDAPIETLDIHVSDNLGTRPLEIYSGGESFRISFALRIALSRLLARRAGASLQTLIVDEGFGTQDAKGREKLVDAINAIKDDFAKIIVVTHIDELKEAFPSRIEVVKTPQGSEVSIVEGGIIG